MNDQKRNQNSKFSLLIISRESNLRQLNLEEEIIGSFAFGVDACVSLVF